MRDDYEHRLGNMIDRGVTLGAFHVPDTRLASYAILAMGMHPSVWYNETGRLEPQEIVRAHEALAYQILDSRADGEGAMTQSR